MSGGHHTRWRVPYALYRRSGQFLAPVGIEASGGLFAEPGAGSRCALTVILKVGHI